MSVGCIACNVYKTNGTQHGVCTVKNVEDANGRLKTLVVKTGSCDQADKILWYVRIHHVALVVAVIEVLLYVHRNRKDC